MWKDLDYQSHIILDKSKKMQMCFFIFQGTTIKPLVSALHVKLADEYNPTMNEQLHGRVGRL